jgi:hypothetical protein
MTDRSDTTVITLRFADGRGKRLELDPRDDGHVDVTERVLTKGGEWRAIGTDRARTVAIDD